MGGGECFHRCDIIKTSVTDILKADAELGKNRQHFTALALGFAHAFVELVH